MTGIYLRCDKCKATLGGEEVSSAPEGEQSRWQLRALASERGWSCYPFQDSDVCPKCGDPAEQARARAAFEALTWWDLAGRPRWPQP